MIIFSGRLGTVGGKRQGVIEMRNRFLASGSYRKRPRRLWGPVAIRARDFPSLALCVCFGRIVLEINLPFP